MYGATKAFVSQFAASLAIEVRTLHNKTSAPPTSQPLNPPPPLPRVVTAQVRANGIDVLAVHPSPVASNFFDKAHKLESLDMAQKAAVSPASVPGKVSTRPCLPPPTHPQNTPSRSTCPARVTQMLTCVGRCHLGDLGTMATTVRVVTALVPYDFLAGIFSFFAPVMGDYKKYNANRGKVT